MIKAKRGKQWYVWVAQHDATWQCFLSDWRGNLSSVACGYGMTRDEAYRDLLERNV